MFQPLTRLPACVARIALAAAFVVFGSSLAFAQDAPAPAPDTPAEAAPAPAEDGAAPDDAAAPAPDQPQVAAQPAEAQPDADLRAAVENFWHYGKIFRYDLAHAEAEKILAHKENPVAVLVAFEQTARAHNDAEYFDRYMFRWQGTQELKDVTSQIMTILNEGRRTRRGNPAAIEDNVRRLTRPGRGYLNAVRDLRESGELAVPVMIDYLRDPGRAEYHSVVRSALVDIGRPALNPLVAVTETKNADLLIPVAGVLGDLGYGAAVPYLARLTIANDISPAARSAAASALARMGADARTINVPQVYFELAEKFYYDNADITADKRDPAAAANVWYWDEQKGLVRVQVPQAIFNEIMAMRASEYSLKSGQAGGDALSLWLASNYKREAELPEGQTDATRPPDAPSAHFYGVDSGAQYLNNALARALRDRNSQVGLRVIKSLQEIIGRSNLFTGGQGTPALIDAMGSTDRLVRFESAFGVAAALPNQTFEGQDRVVPLLAEAISQTGAPAALVMMPGTDRTNATVDALRQAGYNATGGASAEAAIGASNQLPAIDVIITSEDMGGPQVDSLLALAARNAKLAGAAKIVIVRSNASPYAMRAVNDPLLSILVQPPDYEAIKTAADTARARAASAPIDESSATSYALRAAELLARLALTQIQSPSAVLNLAAAEQTVLQALNDPRPDVVRAAGNALAVFDSAAGQSALLQTALAEKTSDDVRVSLLKSLSTSAKFFGNRLNPQAVGALDQVIENATNHDVKNAAAEARGALNLPADQAKTLIVKQSRV